MKKIIFTTIVLFCVTSCFAEEGKEYVITGETMTSTNTTRSGIERLPVPENKRHNFNNGVPGNNIGTSTDVPDQTGKVAVNTEVDSFHDIFIENPGEEKKDYEIKLSLAADQGLQGQDYHVTVDPHGHYEEYVRMFLDVQVREVGEYPIMASSYVVNETGGSEGYGKLTITK